MTELDPDVRALLASWAQRPTPPVSELTAAAVRDDDLAVLGLQRHVDLHSVEDREASGAEGAVPVRIYRPREGPLPTVLFLHGGGFVLGRAGYDAPLRELSKAADCLLVVPEVRLAPEHPFPAAVDAATAVARWLARSTGSLGGSSAPPGIAGDSSGGNLAAVAASALVRDGVRLAFQVLIYPMLDATAGSPSYDGFASRPAARRRRAVRRATPRRRCRRRAQTLRGHDPRVLPDDRRPRGGARPSRRSRRVDARAGRPRGVRTA